jgi:hypothetical protein
MRIEIVDDAGGDALTFPPGESFLDLRRDPHAVDRIPLARAYLALRNFLIAVNSAESVFATAAVAVESSSSPDVSADSIYEFGSRISLVFAEPSLNFDRGHYAELTAGLKELLERDSGESVQGKLQVSSCEFPRQSRRGFCLDIRLTARGDSGKQAELRWGLGLARLQQALLFRARGLGEQIGP